MAADGTITIEIKGDNSDLTSVLNEVTSTINSVTKEWDKQTTQSANNAESAAKKALEETGAAAEDTGSAVLNVFKSITTFLVSKQVANAVMGFTTDAIELASALEEVQNVVDVTFGEIGSAQIEKWASEAGRNFGLTELQAKTYASTIGASFKTLGVADDELVKMTTDLAGLAADMASFYNMDFDTAFNKLFSGLNGQSRPLLGLGIDTRVSALEEYAESLGQVWKEMDGAEQTMLRYQYLMEVTSDVQGDFSRTGDSYANTIRQIQTTMTELKAQLGEALLPVITSVANGIKQFLGIFLPGSKGIEGSINAIEDSANKEISTVNKTADEARGLVKVLDNLSESSGDVAGKQQSWLDTCQKLIEKLPGLKELINQETGALTGGIDALNQYINNWQNATRLDIINKALSEANSQLDNYQSELAILRIQQEAYGKAMVDTGYSPERYNTLLMKRGMQLGIFSPMEQAELDSLEKVKGEYEALAAEKEKITKQITDIEAAEKAVARLTETYNREIDQINASDSAYKNAETTGNAMAEGLNAALPEVTAAVDAIEAQMNRLSGGYSLFAGGGGRAGGWNTYTAKFAAGIDYVPANNYPAYLHAGESVLTAEEARIWRNYKYGSEPSGNAAMLGAILGAMQTGGNVYLDGQTVGRIISNRQADSYRALERSGWRG